MAASRPDRTRSHQLGPFELAPETSLRRSPLDWPVRMFSPESTSATAIAVLLFLHCSPMIPPAVFEANLSYKRSQEHSLKAVAGLLCQLIWVRRGIIIKHQLSASRA